jgi:hypothetical protein
MDGEREMRVWARLTPEMRQRVRDEAAVLYDGNESMLVRRAIALFLDALDRQRQMAAAQAVHVIAIGEREAVAS